MELCICVYVDCVYMFTCFWSQNVVSFIVLIRLVQETMGCGKWIVWRYFSVHNWFKWGLTVFFTHSNTIKLLMFKVKNIILYGTWL